MATYTTDKTPGRVFSVNPGDIMTLPNLEVGGTYRDATVHQTILGQPNIIEWGDIGVEMDPMKGTATVYSKKHKRRMYFNEDSHLNLSRSKDMFAEAAVLGLAVLHYEPIEDARRAAKAINSLRMLVEGEKKEVSWSYRDAAQLRLDYSQKNKVPKSFQTAMFFVSAVPEQIVFGGEPGDVRATLPPWLLNIFEEVQPDLQKELFSA